MPHKRILIFYISESSGHHVAARSIEQAIKRLEPHTHVATVDSFRFTNPILERVITKTYLQVITNTPEIWDYLYDNAEFRKRTAHFRKLIHKFNSIKLKKLIEQERPDAIVCTQAFPCGSISDFKKTENVAIPLIGVVTDFAAHSYWLYDNVDMYAVPTVEVRASLVDHGIERDRVKVLGIPINPAFTEHYDKVESRVRFGLAPDLPVVLIMGGGQGLGPIKDIVRELEKTHASFQVVVVTGINRILKRSLERRVSGCAKPLTVLGYVDNMPDLMSAADMLITKPGGLSTTEALALGLPLLIVQPLPGQETKNAQFLMRKRAALIADNNAMAATIVQDLAKHPAKLRAMGENARHLSRRDSALAIAREILESCRSHAHVPRV